MTPYTIRFHTDWDEYFSRLDKEFKRRVMKKILQLSSEHSSRHLKQTPVFVEEVGQYRICFRIDEKEKVKIFYFVGDHKDYERWYSSVK